jgi:hypothetical protein
MVFSARGKAVGHHLIERRQAGSHRHVFCLTSLDLR